jgi:hypothetical protein
LVKEKRIKTKGLVNSLDSRIIKDKRWSARVLFVGWIPFHPDLPKQSEVPVYVREVRGRETGIRTYGREKNETIFRLACVLVLVFCLAI